MGHGLEGFIEILQIWKEQGFKENKIFIGTYYNLLKRLGWGSSGKVYMQLEKDLLSLYGLEFNADNAYYDKSVGKCIDRKMKLFEGWTIFKKKDNEFNKNDYGYIVATVSFWESMRSKTNFYLPFDKISLKR